MDAIAQLGRQSAGAIHAYLKNIDNEDENGELLRPCSSELRWDVGRGEYRSGYEMGDRVMHTPPTVSELGWGWAECASRTW